MLLKFRWHFLLVILLFSKINSNSSIIKNVLSKVGKEIIGKIPAILIEKGYQELDNPNDYSFEEEYSEVIREFYLVEQDLRLKAGILADEESIFIMLIHT